MVGYPGHTAVDSDGTIAQKTRDHVLSRVIEGWTKTVDASKLAASEPNPGDIVFTGSFDEVNNYYYGKKWGDGLPIMPPTIPAVNEFLKYTPLSPDTNLGLLKPAYRAATVWSVAVNGVMAGCRPEYMPVLVAIARAFADPRWDIQDRGSTIGWEPMAILNGPLMRQLGFNYGVGMFRAGTKANISVSRFMALYLRNIAGFVAGASDKSAFGREQFPLAFVEDELNTTWEPLHVTLGFKKSSNVVTLAGIQTMSKMVQPSASDPSVMLDKLAFLMKYELLQRGHVTALASKENHDLLIMTPLIANLIAQKYTKAQAAAYLYEKTKLPARMWDERIWSEMGGTLNTIRVAYPEVFQKSTDPDRLVPVFSLPEQLVIVVGGDYLRNRAWLGGGVGHMGLMTSKEVQLPKNWDALVPGVLS